MKLEELRWLNSLFRNCNISATAEEHFITQSALSQCLQRVEREVGFPLFERSNKGLRPTEKGMVFSKAIARMLKTYADFEQQIYLMDHPALSEIRIGMAPYIASLCSAGLLLELPCFRSLKRDESLPLAKREVKGVIGWILYLVPAIICTLFSGFSIKKMNSLGGQWFPKSNLYPQDTTGWVSMWAVVCGLFALGVLLVFWLINYIVNKARKKPELTVNPFECGYMKGGLLDFIKTALLGTIIVVGMYAILYCTWGIFKVDFRIWTLDMKVFDIPKMLPTMLRYTRIFAIFYLINGLTNQSYSAKNLPEWLTIAINAFFNVAGIFLVMMIQYGTFKSTGVLWQSGMALGYIVLFPIVPILIIAAIISRNLYKQTGTVWLGAFINALLFTVMTVANTAASFSYVLA